MSFDPAQEYTGCIRCSIASQVTRLNTKSFAIRSLIQDAERILPPGTYYELRERPPHIDTITICWYYSPHLTTSPPGYHPSGGYYKLGNFYTPAPQPSYSHLNYASGYVRYSNIANDVCSFCQMSWDDFWYVPPGGIEKALKFRPKAARLANCTCSLDARRTKLVPKECD